MTMEVSLLHIITGLIGGLIRGLVGITKNQAFTPERFTFQWKYFATTMFVSLENILTCRLCWYRLFRKSLQIEVCAIFQG